MALPVSAGPSVAQQKPKISVSSLTLPVFNPIVWNIMKARGFDAKNGFELDIKAYPSISAFYAGFSTGETEAVTLSGGNQQKVVLAKWLSMRPRMVIFDEPTRGIDVGAKYEIYTIIARLASEGKSIVVISSEMPELLGITDRIYVMNEGRIVGEMAASDASQETIMRAIVRGERKAS